MKNFATFQLLGNIGIINKRKHKNGEILVLSIAVNDSYQKSGETVEKVHWHDCITFSEKMISYVESYFEKGQRVLINGKLNTNIRYKDDEKRKQTQFIIQEIINTSSNQKPEDSQKKASV